MSIVSTARWVDHDVSTLHDWWNWTCYIIPSTSQPDSPRQFACLRLSGQLGVLQSQFVVNRNSFLQGTLNCHFNVISTQFLILISDYRFWTQVLQKFLCGNDLEEYTELCSCGHLDHTEAGEISIVSGLLPGRFEHVPAPVISFDIHAGDVCAFTLNSQAHSLFGRDRSEFEQILNSAIPGSSFQDNVQALSDLLKLVSCESWSSIFNMIKDVCLGVKYDFVSEVSVVSKNGNAISCLLIVRCRLEQKDKVSSIFAMLTPLS